MTKSWVGLAPRSLDRTALAAVIIGVLSAGFYWMDVRPLAGQAQSMREEVAILAEESARSARSAEEPGRRVAPAAQLSSFYAQLPAAGESGDILQRLHRHAREAGLSLESGEYRMQPATSPKVLRYQIVMPVKGTYPQLRRFLLGAMTDLPSLALDGIDFRRVEATQGIEAQLRFTAFLRTPQ